MAGYDYDRRTQAAMGPAGRLKDAEQYIRQGDRQIEQARGVLHGLVKELELVARHTSDPHLRDNFNHLQQLAKRLDGIDGEIDKLVTDIEHILHSFR